jgi:hypothetical protein
MRSYWQDRPSSLGALEVATELHHDLALLLIDDLLLSQGQRGGLALADSPFTLPLLRELRGLAYDASTQESLVSLRKLIGSALPRVVQLCKGQSKLKAAAEDIERLLPELESLLNGVNLVSDPTAHAVSSDPPPLLGRDESPQVEEALTRTARKNRVALDRRAALPGMDLKMRLDEAAVDNLEAYDDPEKERETTVEGVSTQPESLPELAEHVPSAPAQSRKRAHADEAAAPRVKKLRIATASGGENEPPHKATAASVPEEKPKRTRTAASKNKKNLDA